MSSDELVYSRRRKAVVVVAALIALVLLTSAGLSYHENGLRHLNDLISKAMEDIVSSPHRKLLLTTSTNVERPTRIGGDIKACSGSDLVINQDPSDPLPSGIPTYTVEIINTCATGCDIARIHIRCGWFSSASLIDPSVLKRVRYNNCLVNGGRPLRSGQSISFQYANTYSYPLSVSSMKCVQELP